MFEGFLGRVALFLVFSGLLLFAAVSFDGRLYAQDVENTEAQPVYYCYDYQLFLGLLDRDATRECGELEEFIATYEPRDRQSYLEDYGSLFPETNVLRLLATALSANMAGELARSFEELDSADRVLYGSFQRHNDQNRATVYAVFMSSAKADLLARICRESGGPNNCMDVAGFMTAAEMLGAQSSVLDSVSPLDVLYCLMRTDAHIGPIGDVFSSRRFNLCVVENL